MVLVEKWPFFPLFFFSAIQARKMSFTIFQNKKTPFQAIKTRSLKSRKIDIFLKGLTHGFGPKMAIFPTFFFQAVQARKMSFTIFQNEKTLFQAIKTTSSKSRKVDIFPWFWSKNGHFSNFFFSLIEPRKMSFTILQKEKMPFQAIKTRSSKSRKSDIFPKGLTHGFGPKMVFFSIFFFRQGGQENVFCDILERKNAFLGYKKKKFKKLENLFFSKGVNPCFWSKSGQFSNFSFRQYRPGKCL